MGEVVPASEKDLEDGTGADKFTVVLESAGFTATELSSYCHHRDLFIQSFLNNRIPAETSAFPAVTALRPCSASQLMAGFTPSHQLLDQPPQPFPVLPLAL